MKIGHLLLIFAASTFMMQAQNITNTAATAKIKPKPQDGPVEMEKFMNAVGKLWRQGDFESLERMGNGLRTKKLKSSEGMWKLNYFYQGIGAIGEGDAGFLAAEKQVKVWEEKYPESITAPVVEARLFRYHAWFFRGSGYANTITEDGQAKFSKYLAIADEVLEKSKEHCSTDPEWYCVKMSVGQGQGWESAKFDEIFEAGVKQAPDYYFLYYVRVNTLLPRWYGREGEWQVFAEAQAMLHGAEIYTRCAWSVDFAYWPDKLFSEGKVSWPKMKAGFDKMLIDYPDSSWNLNTYCRYACLAGDRATAKELFERIGSNRHSRCWNLNEFKQKKLWANKSE